MFTQNHIPSYFIFLEIIPVKKVFPLYVGYGLRKSYPACIKLRKCIKLGMIFIKVRSKKILKTKCAELYFVYVFNFPSFQLSIPQVIFCYSRNPRDIHYDFKFTFIPPKNWFENYTFLMRREILYISVYINYLAIFS